MCAINSSKYVVVGLKTGDASGLWGVGWIFRCVNGWVAVWVVDWYLMGGDW